LCHLQHKLIGFYNRDEKCLQRGTDWVFKYSGLRFVCKGLSAEYRYSDCFTVSQTHLMRYQKIRNADFASLHSERLVMSSSRHERKRYHVVLLFLIVTTGMLYFYNFL
jgi:hypothetical protein